MRNIITFFFLLLFFSLNAQEFADKEFYLVDSLILDDLNAYSIPKIDTLLNTYHNNDSLIKIDCLEKICEIDFNYVHRVKYIYLFNEHLGFKGLTESKKTYYKGVYLLNLATYYDDLGESDTALLMYEEAAKLFIENNDEVNFARALAHIGRSYLNSGSNKIALEKLKESRIILEKLEEYNKYLVMVYLDIGYIHRESYASEDANVFNRMAINYAKSGKDYDQVGDAYIALASNASLDAKYELAIQYIDTALENFKVENNPNKIAYAYVSFASIYSFMEDYETSNSLNKKALEISKASKYYELSSIILQSLCYTAIEQKEYAKAEKYIEEAYELIPIIKNDALSSYTLRLLKHVYVKQSKYKEAYEIAEEYSKLTKKIRNTEELYAVTKFETEYKYEKQKEIDDLENKQKLEIAAQEKKRTQMGLIFAAILAGLIGLVSIYIFKQKKELDSAYEQLEESKKNELAVSNLKALQSQMNPHFIFNALNSVQDLVLLKDIRNSNKFLGKFSDLIRKILLSSKEQFITLTEELEILSLYLDLEKLRFGDDFIIDLQCNVPEDKQEEIELPAMFIQPYIENAIKHGLFHKQGLKKLSVHFKLVDKNSLECVIEDNGIGQEQAAIFKQKRLHLHTGFSTEAINERIRLLNETSDKKIVIQIDDLIENEKAAGTKITLLFPI